MLLRFALFVLVLCAGAGSLMASETTEWEAKGFKVTASNGVITGLNGNVAKFTADDYRQLGSVTTLKSLQIDGNTITDANFALLSGLTAVEQLSFNSSDLSDDGHKHFASFINLKKLSLFHPSRSRKEFTGSGLAHLKSLPKLESLTFAGANAGDEALLAIGQLQQLQSFRAWHNTETMEGLKHLIALPKLRSLKLGQRLGKTPPSLANGSLDIIVQMQQLEDLELGEARLSYDALAKLQTMAKLKSFKVGMVDTPAADVEKLKQLLIKVKIDWMPITEQEIADSLVKKLHL